ncbi:MAG: hypothetical protein WKG07_48580 [Hymenobacter sp.]
MYESHLIKQLEAGLQPGRSGDRCFRPASTCAADEQGYKRLLYGRADARNAEIPIIALGNQYKAQGFLYHKVAKYNLCQKLCGLYKTPGRLLRLPGAPLPGRLRGPGAAREPTTPRVDEAIDSITYEHESFVVIGAGRAELAETHRWQWWKTAATVGFSYVDETFTARKLRDFREAVQLYADNKDVQQIIRLHLRKKHKGEQVKVFE